LLLLKSISLTDLFFFNPFITSANPPAGIMQLAKSSFMSESEPAMIWAKIWQVAAERVVSPWKDRYPDMLDNVKEL